MQEIKNLFTRGMPLLYKLCQEYRILLVLFIILMAVCIAGVAVCIAELIGACVNSYVVSMVIECPLV